MKKLTKAKPDKPKKITKKVIAAQLRKQKAKTWDAMSLFVRARDKHCVLCGSPFNAQAGHLIKRGRGSTIFDETNVNQQCQNCNIKHNNFPEFYTNWWIAKYGQEAYDDLVRRSWQIKDWTLEELQLIEGSFNTRRMKLEGGE